MQRHQNLQCTQAIVRHKREFMKTTLRNYKYLFFTLVLTGFASANTVTASSVKLHAYELWASTSEACSSPVKVIDNGTSGILIDTISSTDFGQGNLPPSGTYKCLIVVVGDTLTLVPSVTGTTTTGTNQNDLCIAGTTYTQDTCRTGTSTLPDGSTTTCSNSHEDKVAAYISTAGTAGADGNDVAHAKLLNAEIVVDGQNVDKTLYVYDPVGLVNQNGTCGQSASAVLGVR